MLTWTEMREILHPDDRERARVAVEQAIADRSDYDIEYRINTRAGERWVAARGHAAYSEHGVVLGMLGIVQDVTEQRATKELLRDHAETLQIINNFGRRALGRARTAEARAGADRRGHRAGRRRVRRVFLQRPRRGRRVVHALHGVGHGPPALRAVSVTARDVVVRPDVPGRGHVRLGDVTTDPRYGLNEPHFGLPRGHPAVRSYLAIPVVGRSGDVLGGLFFGHSKPDVFAENAERVITGLAAQAAIAIDNARLFDAVQKARESAELANRLKDEFLATVSHELRTPLNAVLGWTSLLRSTKMDAERREKALETIERNAKLQQKIVEDILDVSRIIAGQLRLERNRCRSGRWSRRPSSRSARWPRRKASR